MRKQVVALMDSEESYTVRFMDYVNRKKSAPFEVRAFTRKEQLKQFLEDHYVELLLISERDAGEETENLPAGMTVLLTTDASGSHAGRPAVNKYQSVSEVMREIVQIYSNKERSSPGIVIKPRTNVIGVFSPVGRCGKTSFALALCMLLGRKKASLYVNMESCPGLPGELPSAGGHDLSELIYYIRQDDPNLKGKLLAAIAESPQISLIPPCTQAEELFSVTGPEWKKLLQVIRTETPYEAVVLDLGELPHLIPELLSECDEIYVPISAGVISKAKTEFFMRRTGARAEAVRDRMHRITLSDDMASVNDRWFQRLTYGSIGVAAAECIEREGL